MRSTDNKPIYRLIKKEDTLNVYGPAKQNETRLEYLYKDGFGQRIACDEMEWRCDLLHIEVY